MSPERTTLGFCPTSRSPYMCSCDIPLDQKCPEVEVEYVRADLHRGAVEAAADLIAAGDQLALGFHRDSDARAMWERVKDDVLARAVGQ